MTSEAIEQELLKTGRRPVPVTIAAWLLIAPAAALGIAYAVLSVIAMVASIGFAGRIGGGPAGGGGGGGGMMIVMVLFMILGMVLSLAIPTMIVLLGIGLLRMRSWARTVAVVVCAVILLLILGPVTFGQYRPYLQIALGSVFPVTIILLLLLPASRVAFAEAREDMI